MGSDGDRAWEAKRVREASKILSTPNVSYRSLHSTYLLLTPAEEDFKGRLLGFKFPWAKLQQGRHKFHSFA